MSSEVEQLKIEDIDEEPAPKHLWKTALGRAIFGYYVETHRNTYFVNDTYIESLCAVENKLAEVYGKLLIYGFLFSIFSIATVNNALGEAAYLGLPIAKIPFLTELCSLVLSVIVMVTVVYAIDIHTVIRMRIELFSTIGSESPHKRMVHLKGSGAWLDALLPKNIGYSSNFVHRAFQIFALLWFGLFCCQYRP